MDGRLIIKSGDVVLLDKAVAPGEIVTINLRPGETLESVRQMPRHEVLKDIDGL